MYVGMPAPCYPESAILVAITEVAPSEARAMNGAFSRPFLVPSFRKG